MVDFKNAKDVMNCTGDMFDIACALNKALSENLIVELRVEDSKMTIDSILKAELTEAKLLEELKKLAIEANGLQLYFNYESYELGSAADRHTKFYFKSETAFLTVVVNYRQGIKNKGNEPGRTYR